MASPFLHSSWEQYPAIAWAVPSFDFPLNMYEIDNGQTVGQQLTLRSSFAPTMRRNQLFGSASSSSSLPWGNQIAKAQVRHDPTVAAPQPSIVEARPLLAGRRTTEGMATPIPKSCPTSDSNFFFSKPGFDAQIPQFLWQQSTQVHFPI